MNLILEKLNIDESLKEELLREFDKKVNEKAIELAEAKEHEYEEYIYSELKESQQTTEKTLDAYLEKVVEQFVEDNTFTIDASIDLEKQEAILEGFNALTIATGVEIAQIAEAKSYEDNSIVNESKKDNTELRNMNDMLMKEIMELKSDNSKLLSIGLIRESSEGMTVLEAKRFNKLASIIDYDELDPAEYLEKIDTIVESVVSKSSSNTRNTHTSINEKRELKPDIVNRKREDNTNKKYVSKARHLY